MPSGKDHRISIIRHETSMILNMKLAGLLGWMTHEIQEINYRMAESWLDKTSLE
jgi:hypothetical protein